MISILLTTTTTGGMIMDPQVKVSRIVWYICVVVDDDDGDIVLCKYIIHRIVETRRLWEAEGRESFQFPVWRMCVQCVCSVFECVRGWELRDPGWWRYAGWVWMRGGWRLRDKINTRILLLKIIYKFLFIQKLKKYLIGVSFIFRKCLTFY